MKKKIKTKLWEWQEKCKSGKEVCKCGETRGLTVDHVVPVSLLGQFILDNHTETCYEMEENFEILCRYCNQMKAGRIDPKNPKTYFVLEKILADAKKFYFSDEKD